MEWLTENWLGIVLAIGALAALLWFGRRPGACCGTSTAPESPRAEPKPRGDRL